MVNILNFVYISIISAFAFSSFSPSHFARDEAGDFLFAFFIVACIPNISP